MSIEDQIADHYTTGSLAERIKAALLAGGTSLNDPTPEVLKPVDEFHTGGLEATDILLDQLALSSQSHVLDLGCGIGGTARYVVSRYECMASGIDLTPEFSETAHELSDFVGLRSKVNFSQGSVLSLPYNAHSFDTALMLHVGMNISEKEALMAEVFRVLIPGGSFAIFDVMGGPVQEPLRFPLPWSSSPETSFVSPPSTYRQAAKAAGFRLISWRDRSAFARDFFEKVTAGIEANGVPPLGIHLLMGDTAREKIANYIENLHAGRIAPTELIFRKPE